MVCIGSVGIVQADGKAATWATSQATGALTEIPGSRWFGDADGFGFITGNVVEPLHLELAGLGEDYYVMASVERFGRPVGGAISSSYLAQGQVLTIPIVLTTKFVFLPLINR